MENCLEFIKVESVGSDLYEYEDVAPTTFEYDIDEDIADENRYRKHGWETQVQLVQPFPRSEDADADTKSNILEGRSVSVSSVDTVEVESRLKSYESYLSTTPESQNSNDCNANLYAKYKKTDPIQNEELYDLPSNGYNDVVSVDHLKPPSKKTKSQIMPHKVTACPPPTMKVDSGKDRGSTTTNHQLTSKDVKATGPGYATCPECSENFAVYCEKFRKDYESHRKTHNKRMSTPAHINISTVSRARQPRVARTTKLRKLTTKTTSLTSKELMKLRRDAGTITKSELSQERQQSLYNIVRASIETSKHEVPSDSNSDITAIMSCPHCPKSFTDLASRGRHIRLSHRSQSQQTEASSCQARGPNTPDRTEALAEQESNNSNVILKKLLQCDDN